MVICWAESEMASAICFLMAYRCILCFSKLIYRYPLTVPFILFVIAFCCSIAELIYLSQSKVTIDIFDYDFFNVYNHAIDSKYHTIIIIIIMLSCMIFLTILYFIGYFCHFKGHENEEVKTKNAYSFFQIEIHTVTVYSR